MSKINISKVENHLLVEMSKDQFTKDLKKDLKRLKSVKVFNAVQLTDKVKISIFPIRRIGITVLEIEVTAKLVQIYS